MDKQLKEIEIPFGAKDSELFGWECTIPEGMEATIVDNKIVVKKKDSADEIIINNIKKAVEYYWSDEPLYEILDWLEKRGKKPNNVYDKESSEILGCVIRRYINDPNIPYTEREKVSMETIPYVERLEKQGGKGTNGNEREIPISEQKPAIKLERDDNGEAVLTPFEAELFSMMSEAWQGYSFGEEVNIAKIVKEHSKELLERANEQKPAWNEEDEEIIDYLIDYLEGELDSSYTDLDKETFTKEINWLKSLRPQDWTKEDKERYISCLQRLGTGNPKQPETINSKWFKEHVYPQSYWKPSDEQMQALCSKLPLLTGSGNEVQRVLETLYCDLKKLRNE